VWGLLKSGRVAEAIFTGSSPTFTAIGKVKKVMDLDEIKKNFN